jgi:uncharacterized membrane protein YraQ (UPF0718 family)
MLFDALLATITDLAAGFCIALAIATIAFLIRQEVLDVREQTAAELEAVPEVEVTPAFTEFPERWDRKASTGERRAA